MIAGIIRVLMIAILPLRERAKRRTEIPNRFNTITPKTGLFDARVSPQPLKNDLGFSLHFMSNFQMGVVKEGLTLAMTRSSSPRSGGFPRMLSI